MTQIDPGTGQGILGADSIFASHPALPSAHAPRGEEGPALGRVIPLHQVSTPTPITRASAARHVQVSPTLEVSELVGTIWDRGVHEARELADSYRTLAPSWRNRERAGCDRDQIQCADLAVATALRCTLPEAQQRIRDAHRALDLCPRVYSRLTEGAFPATWFTELIRRTVSLSDEEMSIVDLTVHVWDTGITAEQFTRSLGTLIAALLSRRELPPHLAPENRRRVELTPGPVPGIACVQIQGPASEMVAYSQRLDASARAVQDSQRQALAEGTPIPWDPEGEVEETGIPLSLGMLRYLLSTCTTPDTQGIHVPLQRFRVGCTIPFLTLMGLGDDPGMLDGGIPIPADMARDLAAGQEDWYRVLTDPASGEFLPLPPDRYRPTQAMLEHLRLRTGTCAVPGCTRPSSVATEADHIIEYDHSDPESGGPTAVENLHLLCWQHHAMKTAGVLDPVRVSPDDSPTGRRGTLWDVADSLRVFVEDDTDMATPEIVADLEDAWDQLSIARSKHRRLHGGEHSAGDPPGSPGASGARDAPSPGSSSPPGSAPPAVAVRPPGAAPPTEQWTAPPPPF